MSGNFGFGLGVLPGFEVDQRSYIHQDDSSGERWLGSGRWSHSGNDSRSWSEYW